MITLLPAPDKHCSQGRWYRNPLRRAARPLYRTPREITRSYAWIRQLHWCAAGILPCFASNNRTPTSGETRNTTGRLYADFRAPNIVSPLVVERHEKARNLGRAHGRRRAQRGPEKHPISLLS